MISLAWIAVWCIVAIPAGLYLANKIPKDWHY